MASSTRKWYLILKIIRKWLTRDKKTPSDNVIRRREDYGSLWKARLVLTGMLDNKYLIVDIVVDDTEGIVYATKIGNED